MKFRTKLSLLLLFLSLLPCIAAPADAALFTIASSGNGVFTLSGAGLSGVGGIEATIDYDTATLANPRVVQGGLVSGGMFVANTNSPGAIRIVFISTKAIAGSGVVATISFSRLGESAGRILSLSAGMIDAEASKLPAPQTQVVNPAETASAGVITPTPQPSTTARTPQPPAETPPSPGAGQGYAVPGTITIPGESGEPAKEQPPREILQEKPVAEAKEGEGDKSAPETAPEQKNAAAQPAAAPPKAKDTVYTSVLERFREFKGEKTPKSLSAIFDAAAIPGVRQEPAVALTDGKTVVTVSIRNLPAGKDVPNFVLRAAKLISLKMDGDAWVIEALPDKNAHEADITALHDGSRTEIPLTVVPPVNTANVPAGGFSEAGFILFLKDRGKDKAPRYDLNGDGVRNYLDDYIFTANFIVQRDSKTKSSTRMQQW